MAQCTQELGLWTPWTAGGRSVTDVINAHSDVDRIKSWDFLGFMHMLKGWPWIPQNGSTPGGQTLWVPRKKMGEGGNFFEENKKTWKEMEGSVDSGFRYATNLLYLWPPHVTSPGPSLLLCWSELIIFASLLPSPGFHEGEMRRRMFL